MKKYVMFSAVFMVLCSQAFAGKEDWLSAQIKIDSSIKKDSQYVSAEKPFYGIINAFIALNKKDDENLLSSLTANCAYLTKLSGDKPWQGCNRNSQYLKSQVHEHLEYTTAITDCLYYNRCLGKYNTKTYFPYYIAYVELQKNIYLINSDDVEYINPEIPFSEIVNVYIAIAKDDIEKAIKYLENNDKYISLIFDKQKHFIKENWQQETYDKAFNDWQNRKKSDNVVEQAYTDLKTLEKIFPYFIDENYQPETFKLKLSTFLFSKNSDLYESAYDENKDDIITAFSPIYKYGYIDYDWWHKDKKPYDVLVQYAKDPLNNYKLVRYGKAKKEEPTYPKTEVKDLEIPSGDWTYNDAIKYMQYNPKKAKKVLENPRNIKEHIDYSLFLRAFYPENIRGMKNNLLKVVDHFDEGDKSIGYSRRYDKEKFENNFQQDLDPSNDILNDDFILEVIETASDKRLTGEPVPIYCPIIRKVPKLLEMTSPYYGSGRDRFTPQVNCDGDYIYGKYPRSIITEFLRVAELADGAFMSNFQGTARSAYGSSQMLKINKGAFGYFNDDDIKEYQIKYPYEIWSYLSLENRQNYELIKEQYIKTKAAIVEYYIEIFKMDRVKADKYSEYLLFDITFGSRYNWRSQEGDFQGQIVDEIPPFLRKLLIEGESLEKIVEFTKSQDFLEKQKIKLPKDYIFGPHGSPLISIAVRDVEVLKYLYQLAIDMPYEDQITYDLVMDIDARNNIFKTPLMTAVQFGYYDSAKFLIEKGADVNLATRGQPWRGPNYDSRTALMYAASSGSLDMIKLLLDSGADKYMIDSKGFRAHDYLMGFGPLEYNKKLSDDEFKQAVELLY